MADTTQFRNYTTRYDPGMGLDLICDALNLGLYIGVDAAADASPTISSALIKFLQSGTGAIEGMVQGQLRKFMFLSDFDTSGNFDTAKATLTGAVAFPRVEVQAGTATTDVAALSITRTNNNAAVVKGIDIVFTDTLSNAGFLPLRIRGGAAGTTDFLAVDKSGNVGIGTTAPGAKLESVGETRTSRSGFETVSYVSIIKNATAGFLVNSGGELYVGGTNNPLHLGGGSISGTVEGIFNSTSVDQTVVDIPVTFSPASGTPTQIGLNINPTINWGGTPGAGSYEALRIAVTETSLPTGSNYLIRARAGAAGTTDKFTVTSTGNVSIAGYESLVETTAPAGAANNARIFAQDNGAGKTQLMVIFGSGAAIQLAIEV